MKAIEQYFHVVLFIMLYKVVLTFKSVVEVPPGDTVKYRSRWFYLLTQCKYLTLFVVCYLSRAS